MVSLYTVPDTGLNGWCLYLAWSGRLVFILCFSLIWAVCRYTISETGLSGWCFYCA